MKAQHTWRKSTRSSTNTDCVMVRDDLAAVRDSKTGDDGPAIAVDMAMLVTAVRSGRLG